MTKPPLKKQKLSDTSNHHIISSSSSDQVTTSTPHKPTQPHLLKDLGDTEIRDLIEMCKTRAETPLVDASNLLIHQNSYPTDSVILQLLIELKTLHKNIPKTCLDLFHQTVKQKSEGFSQSIGELDQLFAFCHDKMHDIIKIRSPSEYVLQLTEELKQFQPEPCESWNQMTTKYPKLSAALQKQLDSDHIQEVLCVQTELFSRNQWMSHCFFCDMQTSPRQVIFGETGYLCCFLNSNLLQDNFTPPQKGDFDACKKVFTNTTGILSTISQDVSEQEKEAVRKLFCSWSRYLSLLQTLMHEMSHVALRVNSDTGIQYESSQALSKTLMRNKSTSQSVTSYLKDRLTGDDIQDNDIQPGFFVEHTWLGGDIVDWFTVSSNLARSPYALYRYPESIFKYLCDVIDALFLAPNKHKVLPTLKNVSQNDLIILHCVLFESPSFRSVREGRAIPDHRYHS